MSTVTPETVVEARSLSRVFGDGGRVIHALAGVDLDVLAGELVAVVGPSGSGKTTLLQLLGALDRPTDGTLAIAGSPVSDLEEGELALLRRETIGFVFQQFNLIPTLTAAENVEAAMAPTRLGGRARKARALDLLETMGLSQRTGQLPTRLSGGEQQRVAIARALANEPRLLLADEPTGNLDSETGAGVLELLTQIASEDGRAVVLVTHDVSIAGQAPRRVRMRDGKIAADDAANERSGRLLALLERIAERGRSRGWATHLEPEDDVQVRGAVADASDVIPELACAALSADAPLSYRDAAVLAGILERAGELGRDVS
jgi:putative ABC transport system ATP-binding protein